MTIIKIIHFIHSIAFSMMTAIGKHTVSHRDIALRRDIMIATTLTYIILAASGLIGSAIAWDDLRKVAGKSVAK